jgi:hypothetical protein
MSAPRPIYVVPLVISIAAASCCKRDLQAEHRSPSGAHVLSIVRVDCHAFDSFQTEIRLGRTAAAGDVVASVSSSPVIQVTWVDENLVQIFVPEGYSRELKKTASDGVRIEFR